MELTPKQQTSEAIRQAETILITTGQHPTVDQVAATLALAAILRKFGKKVSAIISDPLPQSAQFLDTAGVDKNLSGLRDFVLKLDVSKAEVDKLRYEVQDGKLNVFITPFKGGFAPSDVTYGYGDYHYDLAIVLGVASRNRIDRVYAENQGLFGSIPLVNLDFHRSNENYGAVNLIEPTASSLCEILVALSESLQTGLIDADIATVMLTGLMASTDRFTANHTTSKSLTVAAQMMAAGARQQTVVRGLFQGREPQRTERSERGGAEARGERPADRPTDRPRGENNRAENGRDETTRTENRNVAPEQPARPAREREYEPVLQPDHIELMPEPAAAAAPEALTPAKVEAREVEAAPLELAETPHDQPPLAPQLAPQTAPVPAEAPVSETPAQPLAVPMADFMAAAEVLRARQSEAEQSDLLNRDDER